MQEKFQIHTAPVPPLRAERRYPPKSDAAGHIQGVDATSNGLVRSTLGAAAAAGAILVFLWLPAEYGFDPTRVGRLLGLTEMGEIKQQLYAEAAAEDAAYAEAASVPPPPAAAAPDLLARLDRIDTQLAAISAIVGAGALPAPAATAPSAAGTPGPDETTAALSAAEPAPSKPAPDMAPDWRDERSYTLAPGEGVEVKLVMAAGDVADFQWTANGAVLNHDTHGDGGGKSITYEQGRGVPGQEGELVAAFSGNHGWFWRNRTGDPVTFTLRTRGAYSEIKAP